MGALILTTCAVQGLVTPDDLASLTAPDADGGDAEETPDEPTAACTLRTEVEPQRLREAADDGTLTAGAAISAGIDCAEQVIVVPADDPALAAIATPLAVASGAPLVVGQLDELADLLADLGDPEVRELARTDGSARATANEEATEDTEASDDDAAGDDATGDDGDAPTSATADLAVQVAEELGTSRFVAAPAGAADHLAAAADLAARTDAAVLPVEPAAEAPDLPTDAEVVAVGEVSDQLPDAPAADGTWPPAEPGTVWMFDPADPAALPTIALAALRGDTVVPVGRGDLLARRAIRRVRDAEITASDLVLVGAFAGEPATDVVLLAEAPLLPGGTLRHFDGTRLVALYGRPDSAALGALGEQDLDATFDRVREVGQGYDADGRQVVPTLEVIVTVASAEAGDDGNYSRVTPPEEFRSLVDRAAEEEMQVILDLQPGRTDFLTQARIYEELLREPHVGLALDPEWRLEPDQVHLRQIGSVDAEEVQAVVDWYAELARETGVAEKLLVLHQFRLDMLPDRDTIEAPREVAVAIHMDGQGPQGTKLETWRTLTAGAEDRWHWAWKNFYDEDPVVAEPGYILDLEPDVVLVTYQ